MEQQPVYRAVGADGQVQAVPGRGQVAEGSAEANPVMIVGDSGSYPCCVRAVVVLANGKSGSAAGLVKGILHRMPAFPVKVVNEYRTVGAMKVVVMVKIGLNLPEVRQDLLETPAIIAQRGPVVEIFRVPAVEGR